MQGIVCVLYRSAVMLLLRKDSRTCGSASAVAGACRTRRGRLNHTFGSLSSHICDPIMSPMVSFLPCSRHSFKSLLPVVVSGTETEGRTKRRNEERNRRATAQLARQPATGGQNCPQSAGRPHSRLHLSPVSYTGPIRSKRKQDSVELTNQVHLPFTFSYQHHYFGGPLPFCRFSNGITISLSVLCQLLRLTQFTFYFGYASFLPVKYRHFIIM